MNRLHHWICRSGYWRRALADDLVPWALEGIDLGTDVLEIGPGYGAATEFLGPRVGRLTCVEADGALADALSCRTAGTNVRVVQADALCLPFPDGCFSSVMCFTMLHHIASQPQQNRLLAEAARVLRHGGTFAGTDSFLGVLFRLIHVGDTLTTLDPRIFPNQLRAAGFADARVGLRSHVFRFRAIRG